VAIGERAPAGILRGDRLALATVVAVSVALATFEASDPDLGFHFATGREVLATGRIPTHNVLSYTQPEHPWLVHYWLPATLLELTRRAGGIGAVIALKIAVVVAIWWLVLAAARRLGASPLGAAAATVIAACGAAFRFVERPLLFSDLTLAATLFFLASAHEAARAPGSSRRVGLSLGGAMVTAAIGCHLHAGALYGLLVLGALAVGALVEPLRARLLRDNGPRGPAGPRAALALAATLAGAVALAGATLALYHPFGLRVLTIPFLLGSDAYAVDHLVEFRPPWRFPFAHAWALWLLLAATASLVLARARRTPAGLLLAVGLFVALALHFVRLGFDLAIVAAPAMAVALTELLARARVDVRERVVPVALAALAIVAPVDRWQAFSPRLAYSPRTFPVPLFEAARAHGLTGPAYVSDGWAGPWLGLYYPEERAFFDPRLEAYDPEFVQGVYQHVRYAAPGWDALLDRYGVERVILRYTSDGERRYQGGADNLRQALARDARWALVAFDDLGEVFARREGPNAEAVRALAIAGVDPDRGAFLGPPALSAASLLAAWRRGEPRSPRLAVLTALALADAGDFREALALVDEALARWPDEPRLREVVVRLGAR
jgi:hypothetical protein